MDTGIKAKTGNLFGKKHVRYTVAGLVILTLTASFSWIYLNKMVKPVAAALKQRTAKVSKGNFSITVAGSGPIISSTRMDVSPKVGGTLTKINFKEGDKVKEGDVLFEMDDYDAKVSAEKIRANLMQAKLSQNSTLNYLDHLSLKAPFSGYVNGITIKAGDVLSKNASVFTITDQSSVKLTVPFSSSASEYISLGQSAYVYVKEYLQMLEGKVTYISDKPYYTAIGGKVYNIEITIDNPGSIKEGSKGSARINTSMGEITSVDMGSFTYANSLVVRADSGGKVKRIIVKENDYVKENQFLVEFENDDLYLSRDTAELKIFDLNAQYENAVNQISYYKIYAPINGTIVKMQTVFVGGELKAGNMVCTVADAQTMEFTIPVDELDIAKVKTGQKVNVSLDAIPETSAKPIPGEVSKIAMEGNYTNGVTTYPVTIAVKNPDNLRGGMNANAEIFITQKKNTLYVPLEAVFKSGGKTYVMVNGSGQQEELPEENTESTDKVKNTSGGLGYSGAGYNTKNRGTSKQAVIANSDKSPAANIKNNPQLKNYYNGTIRKQVEVGINNDSYIEIVGGLKEGDEVILPPVTLGTTKAQTPSINPFASPAGGAKK